MGATHGFLHPNITNQTSMTKRFLFLCGICAAVALLASSCVKTPVITYFDSADSTRVATLPDNRPDISIIQPNDILAITIGSLNKESNEILNFNNINRIPMTVFGGGAAGAAAGQPLGFLVDTNGNVEIPLIGSIPVAGLKLNQAADQIKIQVDKLLREPSVSVRFLNHKFSILGEVAQPGVFNLIDDRTTLPDALAMAGDLTVFGNRQNIMVIRDYYGKREVVRLDLRDRSIFTSPYYFLKNGDMIYIEPVQAKATYTDQRVQLAPLYISIATSVVSIIALITNIVR
ncbi:MAG: polysaccharide biosynthesis/export family protein [Spirosomataceae bacterium]